MNKNHQRAFLRILVLALLFTALGTLILWDYYKVNRDFLELKTLLRDTRYRAIAKNELLAARFIGKQVVITARKSGGVIWPRFSVVIDTVCGIDTIDLALQRG